MAGYVDRNIANLEAALKYSDLTPEQRAQAEKDLQEARANKGGWEDKALGGDPVPKPKEDPVEEMGVRGLGSLGRGLDSWGYGNDDNTDLGKAWRNYRSEFSSMSPHKGMPLSAEDRQAYLAELLENDPASSLYDYSTVKDFSEEENPFRKERMSRGVEGYYSDDTAYVKDLDKLGTQVGPFKGSDFDKQLASVASHELTHPLVEKYDIDMSNIEEPRELPSYGRLHDGTYMPHEKEELLTRMIEMQNFPEEANAEWYFGESPYAISKHPSGAEGYEAGKILQRSLEPALQKYNQLIESEKNPLIYDEATGYNRSDLQRRGIGSFSPHGFEYGNQWQKPPAKQNWFANLKQYAMPAYNFARGNIGAGLLGVMNPLAGLAMFAGGKNLKDSRFYRGATTGAGGYTAAQLNKMNALGGYYSEPAREQRRTDTRIKNLLARKAAGDSYSQMNLNQLTLGSRPGFYGNVPTYDLPQKQAKKPPAPPVTVHHTGGNGGSGSGKGKGKSDASHAAAGGSGMHGGRHYNRGGLAALWPR